MNLLTPLLLFTHFTSDFGSPEISALTEENHAQIVQTSQERITVGDIRHAFGKALLKRSQSQVEQENRLLERGEIESKLQRDILHTNTHFTAEEIMDLSRDHNVPRTLINFIKKERKH